MRSLEESIIYLIRKEPFYAHLLTALNIVEDTSVTVAGYSIQGEKIYLHLNTYVFDQLKVENRAKILVHELLHLIARHSGRQRNRQADLWNIACDAAINQMIEGIPIKQRVKTRNNNPEDFGEINELPEIELGGITFDNIQLADGRILKLPANGFAEQYYNILVKNNTGRQQGDITSARGAAGDNPEKNNSSAIDPNIRSAAGSLHPTWSKSQSMPEELVNAVINEVVEDAVKKCQGHTPANIRVLLQGMIPSRTPWPRILQIFTARRSCNNRSITFKKQNKRLMDQGLPGFKRQKRLNLVVAVDTSASVSCRELTDFAGEILKIKKCGAEITVVECDCTIKNVYKLKKGLDPNFTGRGGTDFRPVWQYLDEHRIRPDAIIYLTDGCGQAPVSSAYPTLWALTSQGEKPWTETPTGRKPVNWGLVIRLESCS